MKVVIAIDSFKGSLTSMEAGYAARNGILRVIPDADVRVKPLADGGEGTTQALIEGLGGHLVRKTVTGPMGETHEATYGILKDNKTAVLEMAEAAGIILVPRDKLDPWKASTTGVGELILDAISNGCREFIIGIGGSATTEGGIGMLCSLGYEFLDGDGNLLPPIFESLGKIARIRDERVEPLLKECHFQIACDVKNPLCGENGAIYVYGPQKGVKLEERADMDVMMRNYADRTAEYKGENISLAEGTGAAGGLGFAFQAFIPNVELKPGIDIVLEAINLEKELEDADICITGEGCLDGQTANGKVPVGVAKVAKKYGAKVLAFAGGVTEDAAACNQEGIDAFFPVVRGVCTLDEAMQREKASKNMMDSVEQVFRLIRE